MGARRRSFLSPCPLALASAALVLALASACRRPPPKERTTKAAPTLAATVRENPRNAIAALVDVSLSEPARVVVEHGDTPAYGETTREIVVSRAGKIVVPIIGLTPEADAHVRVRATFQDGTERVTPDVPFRAGKLPDAVPPALAVEKNENATGFVLVGLYDPARESYVAAMFDRRGRIRWYWVAPPPVTPAAHFDRVRGHFLVVDGSTDRFYELDLASEKVVEWSDTAAPQGLDGHDFLLLPNGNALMIGWEFSSVDSRPLFPKGRKTAIRADHTIDEIDPKGGVVFHWSSADHVDLSEIVPGRDFDPGNFHVVHANSVETFPDGRLLASFRSTNSLVKIDRASGRVLLRIGGKKSDVTFQNDPMGGFSRQHDPHFLPNGEVQLFDNGNQHVPRASRVVRYRLDEAARTATLTWEYHHAPEAFSDVGGSARRLPNGHTLVGFSEGRITEVDDDRHVVWEANTAPRRLYRALYTDSLYP